MQITLTHNSELRLHKVQALHYLQGTEYPISGDTHTPSVGESVEVAKHTRTPSYTEALANIFRITQNHKDLTRAVNLMEQDTLF